MASVGRFRAARPLHVTALALALTVALMAGCGRERGAPPVADRTGTTAAESHAPAAPPAAGISDLPRTPPPAATRAPEVSAADAALRRVVLFSTDLPPGFHGRPLLDEDTEAAAARSPDPAAFRARAQARGRLVALHCWYEREAIATGSSAVRFTTTGGAHTQMEALHADGPAVIREDALLAPAAALAVGGATAVPAPPLGDEALAWRIAGPTPAAIVAFRRGATVVIVLLSGDGDIDALARALDRRAQDA